MWCKGGANSKNKKLNKLIISLLSFFLAVWTGLEPATPCVTGRYSNQLNYHTSIFFCVNRTSGPPDRSGYFNQLN